MSGVMSWNSVCKVIIQRATPYELGSLKPIFCKLLVDLCVCKEYLCIIYCFEALHCKFSGKIPGICIFSGKVHVPGTWLPVHLPLN